MSITLAQILDAITTTLSASSTLKRAFSFDELNEGMNDMPALEVYPESGKQDATTNTDRTTFKAGVRQTEYLIYADYYARQRSHIGEDMKALVDGIDAMTTIFEAQDTKPYFGLVGIRAFQWSWARVSFVRGDPGLPYTGARFSLVVRVF